MKKHSLLIALIGLVVAPTFAQANTLSKSSNSLNSVEFRGAAQLFDNWRFSLRDKATQSSFWVELGRTSRGYTPIAFDRASGILTVQHNGRDYDLQLVEAKAAPLTVVESKSAPIAAASAEKNTIPAAPTYIPTPPPNKGLPPTSAAPTKAPERLVFDK